MKGNLGNKRTNQGKEGKKGVDRNSGSAMNASMDSTQSTTGNAIVLASQSPTLKIMDSNSRRRSKSGYRCEKTQSIS